MFGFLFEHGPCLVNSDNSTEYNHHSWTEGFNTVYIDSPAGSGFSYSDDPTNQPLPNTTTAVVQDVVKVLELLYEAFPNLKEAPLHVAGESFGGHWIPALGAAILELNEQKPHSQALPLRSIMVGNGWTNPVVQLPSLFDVSCHVHHGYPPYLDYDTCKRALANLEPCRAAMRNCGASRDPATCIASYPWCKDGIVDLVLKDSGSSPYDRRFHGCDGDCYQPRYDRLHEYLARSEVLVDHLELADATGGHKKSWVPQDLSAPGRFFASGDHFLPVSVQLERVLADPKVDVLYYAGAADITCNPKGVLEALEAANWTEQLSLIRAEWEELPWQSAEGGVGGHRKSVEGLWMVEFENAGHYVPLDQSELALQMVLAWRDYTGRRETPETEVNLSLSGGSEIVMEEL